MRHTTNPTSTIPLHLTGHTLYESDSRTAETSGKTTETNFIENIPYITYVAVAVSIGEILTQSNDFCIEHV